MMGMNKAIFLDRDGVINEDFGYVHKISDFRIFPGVFDALRKLQAAGFKLIIITNQSGIGRDYYTKEAFFKLNDYMKKIFNEQNIKIDKIYFCPHHPDDNCDCRKPKTKFIQKAVKEFDLDIKSCWVIGDKLNDVEMGEKGGCKIILLESKYTKDLERFKLKNLYDAVQYILKRKDRF